MSPAAGDLTTVAFPTRKRHSNAPRLARDVGKKLKFREPCNNQSSIVIWLPILSSTRILVERCVSGLGSRAGALQRFYPHMRRIIIFPTPTRNDFKEKQALKRNPSLCSSPFTENLRKDV
ncbi:hypothetical protein FQN55_001646 [Onygenales sp. PD_40]|nr:hypothetical protein FQN55_001646 [Onygenales sp. PD_40]